MSFRVIPFSNSSFLILSAKVKSLFFLALFLSSIFDNIYVFNSSSISFVSFFNRSRPKTLSNDSISFNFVPLFISDFNTLLMRKMCLDHRLRRL